MPIASNFARESTIFLNNSKLSIMNLLLMERWSKFAEVLKEDASDSTKIFINNYSSLVLIEK